MTRFKAASLFSGIGAPEVAMPGWNWLWHAEIEAFPSAVMAARHPGSINLGDVNAPDFVERALDVGRPDVIVFGSPCQSYSVAGKRLGLDDPRGNLALVALDLVRRIRPRWFLFENVPGLLSSWSGAEDREDAEAGEEWETEENSDFAAFLGAVRECGYLGCWRSLDAQFAGLAQRRERVFFVGCAGDWRYPCQVFSFAEGMQGHPPPGHEARQAIAGSLGAGSRRSGGRVGRREAAAGHVVADTLNAAFGSKLSLDNQHIDNGAGLFVTHSLRADAFDASEACSISGCGGKRHAGGYCRSHYSRAKRHGDPLAGRVSEGEPIAFLLAHVDHQGAECVSWPYAILATGYGSVSVNGKTTRVHRHMCELAHGAPPTDKLDAAHSCGNRTCINPKHLRWASRAENMADTLEHGTAPRGEQHGAHKLTESAVLEIRERLERGETHDSIAIAFGVGRNAITDIASRKNWGWLDGTGRGTPLVPVAFNNTGQGWWNESGTASPIRDMSAGSGSKEATLVGATAVRRLTPRECERLQGFPDDYTLIKYRGKDAADGNRYKALGNSMAVPVVRWLLTRISQADAAMQQPRAAA